MAVLGSEEEETSRLDESMMVDYGGSDLLGLILNGCGIARSYRMMKGDGVNVGIPLSCSSSFGMGSGPVWPLAAGGFRPGGGRASAGRGTKKDSLDVQRLTRMCALHIVNTLHQLYHPL